MKGAQNLFWMMTGHHRFPKNQKEEHVFSNQETEYSWGSKGVKGCQMVSKIMTEQHPFPKQTKGKTGDKGRKKKGDERRQFGGSRDK